MHILQQEKVSAYSHGALIPVMLAGAVFLAILAGKNIELMFFLLIYGLSATTLFTASFLYHAKKKTVDERSVWRKIDRSSIFVLIAGTAAPLCFLYLDGVMMWGIFAVQWFIVLLCIAFCFFINAPRKISTIVYLLMGITIIIPFGIKISVIPPVILALFIAGNISYLTGAVVYAIKKPNRHLHSMGFHEIFHMFVIAGAIFHLLMIIGGVTIYLHL